MTYPADLVFGLLDISDRVADRELAERLRGYTISWSRYGYPREILEDRCVNAILDRALQHGKRWCFLQAHGHVLCENWVPRHWNRLPFEAALARWVESTEFLITGWLTGNETTGYGLDDRCLLVDLARYAEFGRPRFDAGAAAPGTRVRPMLVKKAMPEGPEHRTLLPGLVADAAGPARPGGPFIEASLRHGLPVHELDPTLQCHTVWFGPPFPEAGGDPFQPTDPARCHFLEGVDQQVRNCQRGVFLWNLESYDDVRPASVDFQPPTTALYAVASGFKPNVILDAHGFDERTRVVFFDYSPNALEVRRTLRDEWDGQDYPSFIRYLFRKFPAPETYYQLWSGATPATLNWEDADRFWQAEMQKWGGERAFVEHWRRYRCLPHEYVRCNILTEPERLFDRMDRGPGGIVWWSNAFFTIAGNWQHTPGDRRRRYETWITGLAARNPDVELYGSDWNNTSVNQLSAGRYWQAYQQLDQDDLVPHCLGTREIRF